jgi:hypothetical protein
MAYRVEIIVLMTSRWTYYDDLKTVVYAVRMYNTLSLDECSDNSVFYSLAMNLQFGVPENRSAIIENERILKLAFVVFLQPLPKSYMNELLKLGLYLLWANHTCFFLSQEPTLFILEPHLGQAA